MTECHVLGFLRDLVGFSKIDRVVPTSGWDVEQSGRQLPCFLLDLSHAMRVSEFTLP